MCEKGLSARVLSRAVIFCMIGTFGKWKSLAELPRNPRVFLALVGSQMEPWSGESHSPV